MNLDIVQAHVAALHRWIGPRPDDPDLDSPLALAAGMRAAFVFAAVVVAAALLLGAFSAFVEVDTAGAVSCVPALAACA